MDYPKIAVAMIVKATDDEAPLLANALASLNGFVDAFYINLNHRPDEKVSNKVRLVAEQYADPSQIFTTEWTGDFAGARNFIFDKVPKKYDWIMWIDTDDTVANPEKIRDVVAICSKQIQGIFLKYDYAQDEFGNVTVAHWVCRIARNNGTFAWKSSFEDEGVSVHETLNETRSVSKVMNDEVRIVHHSDPMRRFKSLQRNIRLLEGMYQHQTEKGNLDPRILFYLGTHYFDANQHAEAKQLLQDYMQLSGWNEERAEALIYLGKILIIEGKVDQAKHAFMLAIGENPKSPLPYIELAELEYKTNRFEQSIDLLNIAIKQPKPKTTVVLFPMESTFRAYMLLAQSYVNLGGKHLDDAVEFVQKALKLRPLDEDAQNAQDLVEQLMRIRDETKAAMRLVHSLEDEGKKEEILTFLDQLPKEIQDSPSVIGTRQKYMVPKKWPKKSIAIYVGPSPLGIWGPWSMKDGISGSEEAVIHLSSLLARMGWEVKVFGTPGERAGTYTALGIENAGEYEGDPPSVEWRQYWEFNAKDTYDILIGWRSPWFFDGKYKARKQYLWLHDVIDKPELTPDRLNNIDKVIFVSQYHADLYKEVVPIDKVFVSSNGIDPAQLEKYDDIERNPHKLIYTSAHERGLKVLYDIWPEVRKEVPDATLDVYYGWAGYDAINRDNPERMAWKTDLIKQEKKLDGVKDHGRIGHDEIAKALSSAAIFAYPCIFPEVYCISLIKAMAAGTYPVTSDFAVLKDFNELGTKVELKPKEYDKFKENYKQELIKALKSNGEFIYKSKMIEQTRKNFSWEKTAKGWDKEMR